MFHPYSLETHYDINLPGNLLMRLLQFVTAPLIVKSVIIGVANLSEHMSKKIALRAAIFFVLTTVIAVLMDEEQAEIKFAFIDSLLDLVRSLSCTPPPPHLHPVFKDPSASTHHPISSSPPPGLDSTGGL
ncbi:Excitatory amino acid transporter 3 [Liparis tanakae]|uniref:Amino acid transporter n=1 Tax=Liparis tanakae TaxID=230148 RepID=A0A4Z2HGT2_9TELE|nr:Excitatory amino acid transporter 3 [Liparis tanakae]